MRGQKKRQGEFVNGLRPGLETLRDEYSGVMRQIGYHDIVPPP